MIASVGTFSGPAGAVFRPGVDAVQVWVSYVNARSGVSGRLVKLIVYDDGGDPARHKAQAAEAIEQRHVIAFVYNADGVAGKPSQDYITAKRVPVIGSEAGSQWFYESPMYFPHASSGRLMFAQGIYSAAQQLVAAGKTKVATVTCEFAECGTVDKVWAEEGPKVGFEVVYRARASVAQPDFTAECLAAHNAGAQVFLVAMDTNSLGRLALSCARQGYRPVFGTVSSIAADRLKDDPNLDGMVASSNVFPYFQSGTPATDEFQRVMRAYGSKLVSGVSVASGWVAAKIFERATAHLPEPPTSEAVLRGLWSLRNDTLGGLTQPLTFIEDKTAPLVQCWYNLALKNQAWTSPDGYKLNCR